MSAEWLSREQCHELVQASDLADQNGDRTGLQKLLISIMKKMVERLREGNDDVNEMDRVDDSDREFLISFIENELATMAKLQRNFDWCCRSRRIQPVQTDRHRYSDYLISFAKGNVYDEDQTGFISKDLVQKIFDKQLHPAKLAELIRRAVIDREGRIQYADFGLLVLIAQ